jgi:hypothetical protein
VVDGPEAPVSCVDDAETARSRPWIDADDFHAATLGSGSDVSFLAARRKNPGMAGTWLTFPDGSEHELADRTAIGRNTENDLVMHSSAVSREHAAVTFRDGRWYLEDRGSFNGTYLNGTRLVPGTPLPLHTPTGSGSAARRSSSPGRRSGAIPRRPSRWKRSPPQTACSCRRSSVRSCRRCVGRGSRERASRPAVE